MRQPGARPLGWTSVKRGSAPRARGVKSGPCLLVGGEPRGFLRSGCPSYDGRRLDAVDDPLPVSGQPAKVAFHLNTVPELVRLTEEGAEANRHDRRDRPPAMYDFVNCARSNADRAAHRILRDSHRPEVFLKKNLTRCNLSIHITLPNSKYSKREFINGSLLWPLDRVRNRST